MMLKKKPLLVGFFTGKIANNRIPWLEKIGSLENIILVIYSNRYEQKYYNQYKSKHNLTSKYYFRNTNPLLLLLKYRWDCLVIGGYSNIPQICAFLYAKFYRIPIVMQSESTPIKSNLIRRLGLPIIKLFVQNADAIAVTGIQGKIFHIQCGVRLNDIHILRYVIDNDFFSRADDSRLNKLKNFFNLHSKQVILFAGRLVPEKNPFLVLEVYKILQQSVHNLAIFIIGSGPLEKQLKSYVKKNNLNNTYFVNYVEDRRLYSLYFKASDLFFYPAKHVTWGLVINEALACGLPVITSTGVGAASDLVINGKNGYIFQLDEKERLIKTIHIILNCENIKMRMSEYSLSHITNNYSLDQSADDFKKVVHYVINNRSIIL